MSNTTSFELSKQLFEVAKSKGVELPKSELLHEGQKGTYQAYTTDELLAWLPAVFNNTRLTLEKRDSMFHVSYANNISLLGLSIDIAPSNALAKLAIYLIEKDLLK